MPRRAIYQLVMHEPRATVDRHKSISAVVASSCKQRLHEERGYSESTSKAIGGGEVTLLVINNHALSKCDCYQYILKGNIYSYK